MLDAKRFLRVNGPAFALRSITRVVVDRSVSGDEGAVGAAAFPSFADRHCDGLLTSWLSWRAHNDRWRLRRISERPIAFGPAPIARQALTCSAIQSATARDQRAPANVRLDAPACGFRRSRPGVPI